MFLCQFYSIFMPKNILNKSDWIKCLVLESNWSNIRHAVFLFMLLRACFYSHACENVKSAKSNLSA